MSTASRKRVYAAALLAAAAALVASSRPLLGSREPRPSVAIQPLPQAVQTIPGGYARVAAKPGEKGATYYWLEGQVRRVVTHFPDAVVTAERAADGDLETRVTDTAGNEVGRLRVDRVDDANHVVQYMTAKGEAIQALGRAGAKPTLDWANEQAYSLWKDRVKPGVSLEWQGALMRPRQAGARPAGTDIQAIDVEWPDGITATAERRADVRATVVPGRTFRGPVVISKLRRHGTEIGVSNWFPQNRVFVWNIPGVSSGYFDQEILKSVGGWTFEPDVFWVNLQTIAFLHFKTLLDERGTVAQRQPGWVDRVTSFFEPTLQADDAGCDGLHWLDGTVFRYCCDTHDLCYSKYGCTSYTWWQWWSSWQCDGCNLGVVYCFAGGHGIFSPYAGIQAVDDPKRAH